MPRVKYFMWRLTIFRLDLIFVVFVQHSRWFEIDGPVLLRHSISFSSLLPGGHLGQNEKQREYVGSSKDSTGGMRERKTIYFSFNVMRCILPIERIMNLKCISFQNKSACSYTFVFLFFLSLCSIIL